ncbi:MAG: SDR family NAD(P)-dependent oxidoreductase [Chitinophagaceae bacterium]|nr:MAG: SDR family NAD(P)-dependent oxidoreductase [Chitinophagaceae bacterium]
MKLSGNTILISGGTAGIGLEMAKLLARENKVIITGRDQARLDKALESLPGVTGIRSDISDNKQADELLARLHSEFPDLNIVINNAGRAVVYNIGDSGHAYEYARDEMNTNFLAIVRFNDALLPAFKQKTNAAIVNVSSVVAFAGSAMLATYAATKAALHSYSRILRYALKDTPVKVFELMPPLVNTEFSREIGGEHGIAPGLVAQHLVDGLLNDQYEIHSGNTEDIYQVYLSSPEKALEIINQTREKATV